MEKFILIDGNSLINRAFYALPPMDKDGLPTQAVYGFATMLIRLIQEIKPEYIAVAFDLPAPTFRHLKYTGYKSQRKGMPDELAVQLAPLKELLVKMGISIFEKEGFEADDIIGTLAKHNDTMTYIVTGDKDSLQLIDPATTVMLTKRGITEVLTLDERELFSSFGLTPAQIIDYKAIAGDKSDSIPGVAGIGDKGAIDLLQKYGSLDGVYANLDSLSPKLKDKLIASKDMAYLSKELATIDTNVEIDTDIQKCGYVFPFKFPVKQFFLDFGFKSLVKRNEIFDEDVGASILSGGETEKPLPKTVVIENIDNLSEILKNCHGSIAFALGENVNFAFDNTTEYIVNLSYNLIDGLVDYTKCINSFKRVLEDDTILKTVYDAKKLKKSLNEFKISLHHFWDVKLAQYIEDVTLTNETLEKLAEHYALDLRELATNMLYLKERLDASIKSQGMEKLFYEVEQPLVGVLCDMEKEGFRVDLNKLQETGRRYSHMIEEISCEIFGLCGQTFNLNSPKQLSKVLFEDMKIPYPKKSSSFSTGADILELIAPDYEVANKILKFRLLSKLNSTYVEGLRKMSDVNGVIHTDFRQTTTLTGRLSSVEPNLQNIPVREEEGKALRAFFTAAEGKTLVSADYSQIELRLLAHFSGDATMKTAFVSGEDIHLSTAAEVFGVDKQDVTSTMRRDAKAVNFGIVYGISDFGLAQNLKISRLKAKEYIETYFKRFPGIKKYLDDSVAFAKEHGYAVTVLGRRRKIKELFSPLYNIRQFGERVAMNMPLQGSAADIIKVAMLKVSGALQNMKSKLILQIHDELIVEAADGEVEAVKRILKECMENAVSLSVPLPVDVGSGKSWLDC